MLSSPQLVHLLSPLDWIIFFFIFFLTFLSIWYGNHLAKKENPSSTSKDSTIELLLMGRRLTLPLFIGTLVATWYGGIFGVTAISFNQGIYNFLTQGIFWYISYFIFALFIVKKISNKNVATLPELIEKLYGKKSRYLSAIFNLFNVIPISYVISLGLFSRALFGGSLILNMSIGVAIVTLYSMYGGFKAIVFSDLIQFFVMCISVFLVILFSYLSFGGIDFLKANLPVSHFNLLGKEPISSVLVWGFIALATLIDPNFYQRCFAAKSTKVARNGILISIVIWIFFDLCTTFGALYARALIPHAAAKNAYLYYAIQILPNGFRGFFLAGILATILSTIDSYLFIASTTLTYDLLPNKNPKKLTHLKHISGLLFIATLSIVLAVVFDGDIKKIWKILGSLYSSTLLIPVIVGFIFPGRISDNEFFYSSIAGIIFIILNKYLFTNLYISNFEIFYLGIIGTISALILMKIFKHLKYN